MKRKITKSLGKNLKEIPVDSPIYEVNIHLSDKQLDTILLGVIATNMEEKWFIYEEKSSIYLHRSWTGICICKLQIKTAHPPKITSIQINSDESQFNSHGKDEDIKLIIEELNNTFKIDLPTQIRTQ